MVGKHAGGVNRPALNLPGGNLAGGGEQIRRRRAQREAGGGGLFVADPDVGPPRTGGGVSVRVRAGWASYVFAVLRKVAKRGSS